VDGPPGASVAEPSAGLRDILGHPLLKDIAAIALKQALATIQPSGGLPTVAMGPTAPESGLIDIMRNPLVSQTIANVISQVIAATKQSAAALPANGLSLGAMDTPSAGLGDLLRNLLVTDIVRTVLSQVLATTQPSHGLSSSNLNVDEPSAGLRDLLRNPLATNIVSVALKQALAVVQPSHGLPFTPGDVPSAGLAEIAQPIGREYLQHGPQAAARRCAAVARTFLRIRRCAQRRPH
jgi:hypothetical protein